MSAAAVSRATRVHAGFVPLTDCAPLAIAKELRFDRDEGFSLELSREASWANIRDKVEAEVLDCAIMLAPMPLASTLGLGGRPATPLIAAMATSLNGNAITVSRTLFDEMTALDAASALAGGMQSAKALARVVEKRREDGREPLTLGIVYPFSAHNYDLRYWLASAGVDPDHDVNLVVVPPPLTAVSLTSGRIDGFCVGMPWNSQSVDSGDGVILATKSQLWSASPEKVLGMKLAFAEKDGDLTVALIRALTKACAWLDEPENRSEAAKILAEPRYVGLPSEIISRALLDQLSRGAEFSEPLPGDTLIFHKNGANFPWTSHAVWFLTQMIRWGQARAAFDIASVAGRVYRPDIFRRAAVGLGLDPPAGDMKPESGGGFFGADAFDPAAPIEFLERLPLRHPSVDLKRFGRDGIDAG